MQTKKKALVDVPVLCIFFARPEIFKKSFERVKEVRPSKLLLWQDGPRENRPEDIQKIEECRKIVENIDWECDVYTNFHEKNMGCDPSTHYAHKWAFSIVDKCIILEDDIVPSISFFYFCKELLDEYEKDQRIDRICGMNILGEYECDGDYFFSRYGNSWGWATWKRVADRWESDYRFLNNAEAIRLMEGMSRNKKNQRAWIKKCIQRKLTGKPYWEFIVGASTLLNSGLCIYPRFNLIKNVGIGQNSTHAPIKIEEVDKTTRKLFYSKTFELKFPLKTPNYVIADEYFFDRVIKSIKVNKFELFIRRMRKFTPKKFFLKLAHR